MSKVKILAEGYALRKQSKASSTVTLICDKNLKILVDPGIDRVVLEESLRENNISKQAINFIIVTHNHIDHCALMGIFPNAKIVDNDEISTLDGQFKKHDGSVPKTTVKIIPTPGHSNPHCSVLVEDDELGRAVIAGDLFWWWDDEAQKTDIKSLLAHRDIYVKDNKQLLESRKRILDIADYIIPGHGKMFKVIRN
ncbi:MAG: MBL fold metallo-hydrolase [bacterium]|nr:MBL fold metallo-hydrolase [bacterium]